MVVFSFGTNLQVESTKPVIEEIGDSLTLEASYSHFLTLQVPKQYFYDLNKHMNSRYLSFFIANHSLFFLLLLFKIFLIFYQSRNDEKSEL